jgi:hypothetical protein
MAIPLTIIIVEKEGNLKSLNIKDFKVEELFKKCGFKKVDGFMKRVEWSSKIDGIKYFIEVHAKSEGRANTENKYDFPPPIDNTLLFGCCAIVAYIKQPGGNKLYTDLNLKIWDKIYTKLFGGFEDLVATAKEDEEEEDELANVPKEKKTKDGYLKDGFVVDSEQDENETESSTEEEDIVEEDTEDDTKASNEENIEEEESDSHGSELSEEAYDYDN